MMKSPIAFAATLTALVSALAISLNASVATAQTSPAGRDNANLVKVTPQNAVFVYVDFNTGLDNQLTTVPGKQFRNNVAAFAKLNPIFKVPTAIFGEENDYYGPFYPEITQHVTHDAHRFHRTTPSGYTPEFAEWLKKTGRKNVVIGGISIDNCTLHTSLDLLRAGYNVFVVLDVSSTNNQLAEDAAVRRLTNAGAVGTTWLAMATELVGDWNTPLGRELMAVVGQHLVGSTVGTPADPTPDGKGIGAGS